MYYEYASHAISIKVQLMQTSKTHLFKRTGNSQAINTWCNEKGNDVSTCM